MASGTLKEQRPKIIRRAINIPYSFSAGENAQFNTNLSTLLNNDCPEGYSVLGIAGWTTNSIYVIPIAFIYLNSNYSLQLRHLSTTAESGTFVAHYLCIKN